MSSEDKNNRTFALEDFKLNPISSAEPLNPESIIDETEEDILSINAASLASESVEPDDEVKAVELDIEEETEPEDLIFKELSAPVLPELMKEDRARLQMQSPNRIHFYWSFKQNPYKTLSRIVGNQSNYQLVIKLVNQTNAREEYFPADMDGTAWFDVDAASTYQAEIGFYAINRPFVRLMFSNTIETPRKNPSPRRDFSANFAVSADQFAEVLDVSGFPQDAFEVALAGDDISAANDATHAAFSQIVGEETSDYKENQSGEIRFILLALASGHSLENLRAHVSPSLFNILESNAEKLNVEKALAALQENFSVFDEETFEESNFEATVFGASLINFPRFGKRQFLPKLMPSSSVNIF